MIFVEETTVNVVDVDPSLTAVAPVKLVPLIVTSVPVCPAVGEKLVILGGCGLTIENDCELTAVPSEFVTEIFPLVAPFGTVAVIFVSELIAYPAEVPLNFTEVVPVKPLPLIVTAVPTGPLVGAKFAIDGGWVATLQLGY